MFVQPGVWLSLISTQPELVFVFITCHETFWLSSINSQSRRCVIESNACAVSATTATAMMLFVTVAAKATVVSLIKATAATVLATASVIPAA